MKSGRYRVPKLPPLSVKYVCSISRETNHPIIKPKIVLKSVLWRGSESAQYFCIFQLLGFSLHPSDQSSHRDMWSHSKMTLLAWIICTLGGLGVSVDQREDCLDHLGNHLRPYTTIRLHRHNIFKRGLIAVFIVYLESFQVLIFRVPG